MVSCNASSPPRDHTDDPQNSKSLRRLAADHGALHSEALPPNYLFAPDAADTDDLTELDILLAGPSHTPFAAGVWKLHLAIPNDYPQHPPTANFRTPIFHPNVDPQTGGVCVETLKRDWDNKLTLRDVLITISCLLIQPNPDSALNAEAGALIQESYDVFARRAKLMTSINAGIPRVLQGAVKEAQMRGQEHMEEARQDESEEEMPEDTPTERPQQPVRRRRTVARLRATARTRHTDGSPSEAPAHRRPPPLSRPVITQSRISDPFGISIPEDPVAIPRPSFDDDDSIEEADQENDETLSPVKAKTPKIATPRRPQGAAVPLGELTLEDAASSSSDSDMEAEYPPSPRKSPSKSPAKRRPNLFDAGRAESSRDAALAGGPTITPPNFVDKPLAEDSPFMTISPSQPTPSPKKARPHGRLHMQETPPKRTQRSLFDRAPFTAEGGSGGMLKARSPSSADKRRQEKRRRAELDVRLWQLCGGDIVRWNRGDFDGRPFKMKAARW